MFNFPRLNNRRLILLLTFWFMLFPSAGFSTQIDPRCSDLKYVSQLATVIVHGTVTKVRAQKEVHGEVFSYIEVEVDKYLKGEGSKTITIKMPGGTIEEDGHIIISFVASYPGFQVGEKGYLYLQKLGRAYYNNGDYYDPVCLTGVKQTGP